MKTSFHEIASSAARVGESEFLAELGRRARALRTQSGLSRKLLAEKSGLSERYIAQLEAGKGNVSVLLLRRICHGINVPIAALLHPQSANATLFEEFQSLLTEADPKRIEAARRALREPARQPSGPVRRLDRVALIGLRGAGKSTLARLAADELKWPFFELNREIERDHGLQVHEIFPLYGQNGYRRLEQASLRGLTTRAGAMLLATNGGLVSDALSMEILLENFYTIWIKASPDEHLERVRAQGKTRIVADDDIALEELRAILGERELQYARAHATIDTTGKSVAHSLHDLLAVIAAHSGVEVRASQAFAAG
ncbi:MAG: helix-turn-helix transcriptional regulator [Hyphomicrobiales bacterium]|nr:helix-turn-helix transcriptional regulator [Hyphomicrobiales bacterium]